MPQAVPAGSVRARPRLLFFPLIDLVRAFAAVTVLVYHLIGHWEWEDFPAWGPLAWFQGGWMAVDVFFVISGFVIALSAFGRMDASPTRFRAAFLRSRLARIVPLHWFLLLVFVVAVEPAVRSEPGFAATLLAHLLFLHNLSFDWYGQINGPSWSLGTEMQFYLLVALAAPWLRRIGTWQLLALALACAWGWRWACVALYLPGPLDRPYMAQTQLPGMLDAFALGLLLARLVRSDRGQALLARVAGRTCLRYMLAVAVAACWWAIVALYLAHDYWEVPAMAVFFRTGIAVAAALTLLVLCGWPLPRSAPFTRTAAYLGKISYGIYLWHLPVLLVLGRQEMAPGTALAIALPATIALAALTWHVLEEPLLRKWAAPAPGQAPAQSRGLTAG